MFDILDAYAEPDKSFDDLRRSIGGDQFPNKLRVFSEACKNELRALNRMKQRASTPPLRCIL
jgi:hypothetical protein